MRHRLLNDKVQKAVADCCQRSHYGGGEYTFYVYSPLLSLKGTDIGDLNNTERLLSEKTI